MDPTQLYSVYSEFVHSLSDNDVHSEIEVSLPVLPRTGSMRRGQVSLEVFNSRAEEFNNKLFEGTFVEDLWWVWDHWGLKHRRYSLDGVHLNRLGTIQYERTLRQIVKFFEYQCWC